MISVYILAKLEGGREGEVLNCLKTINQVRKARLTYGTYDLCIEALFKDLEELDDFVFNVLRMMTSITETVTLMTSRSVSSKPSQAI